MAGYGTRKGPKTKGKEMTKAERKMRAVEMRKNAMSVRKIAEALGCTHPTILNDLKEGLAEFREQTLAHVEEYRAIQIARREEIIEAHKAIALDPSHDNWKQACDVIDKNEIAISKLMGTDQPIKVEQKTEHSGEAELVFKVFEPDIMPTANNEIPSDGDTDTAT